MYDGNPEEIDFGSSEREVRLSEGSSYRESTVFSFYLDELITLIRAREQAFRSQMN